MLRARSSPYGKELMGSQASGCLLLSAINLAVWHPPRRLHPKRGQAVGHWLVVRQPDQERRALGGLGLILHRQALRSRCSQGLQLGTRSGTWTPPTASQSSPRRLGSMPRSRLSSQPAPCPWARLQHLRSQESTPPPSSHQGEIPLVCTPPTRVASARTSSTRYLRIIKLDSRAGVSASACLPLRSWYPG